MKILEIKPQTLEEILTTARIKEETVTVSFSLADLVEICHSVPQLTKVGLIVAGTVCLLHAKNDKQGAAQIVERIDDCQRDVKSTMANLVTRTYFEILARALREHFNLPPSEQPSAETITRPDSFPA